MPEQELDLGCVRIDSLLFHSSLLPSSPSLSIPSSFSSFLLASLFNSASSSCSFSFVLLSSSFSFSLPFLLPLLPRPYFPLTFCSSSSSSSFLLPSSFSSSFSSFTSSSVLPLTFCSSSSSSSFTSSSSAAVAAVIAGCSVL